MFTPRGISQRWLGLADFLVDIEHALETDEATFFRGDLSLDHPDGEGEQLATLLEYSGSAHWQGSEEAHLTGRVAHQDANGSLACGWVAARSQGDFSSLSIARINHRDWLVEAGIDGVMQAISALHRDAVNFQDQVAHQQPGEPRRGYLGRLLEFEPGLLPGRRLDYRSWQITRCRRTGWQKDRQREQTGVSRG